MLAEGTPPAKVKVNTALAPSATFVPGPATATVVGSLAAMVAVLVKSAGVEESETLPPLTDINCSARVSLPSFRLSSFSAILKLAVVSPMATVTEKEAGVV